LKLFFKKNKYKKKWNLNMIKLNSIKFNYEFLFINSNKQNISKLIRWYLLINELKLFKYSKFEFKNSFFFKFRHIVTNN
jgi:hypothetical protein